MRSSIFNVALFSAISCGSFSQAAPIAAPIEPVHERASHAPKAMLDFTETSVTGSTIARKALPQNRDLEDDVSVFSIKDTSGFESHIKHIVVPKTFPADAGNERSTTATPSTDVDDDERTGDQQPKQQKQQQQQQQNVSGGIATCGVDSAGRNYCRTTDGWFEYRCETGEVSYHRHVPYADEEVCSDGSIA